MIEIKTHVCGELNNNCYLITDTKSGFSALVDCTEFGEGMCDFIGDAKLQYILLTHGHFDHIAGVKQMSEKYGAKVVISEQDRDMLLSSRRSLGAFFRCSQESVEADVLVLDGDLISLGESEILVLSTPGHTKGSVCYVVENSVFSGDTLFYHSCGRTDFPGGSMDEMASSLKKLAALNGDYNVYPGHDIATTLDDERKNNTVMMN